MGKTFHIITFGCQMNVHDSRWLARALDTRGFVESGLENAGVVIINTCSVREKPEQKVKSAIGRVHSLTKGNPDVLVAVTGCVAQQLGEKLFDSARQVRLVAGSDGINDAPAAIERLLAEPDLRLSLLDFTDHYREREAGKPGRPYPVAYVNIMQGCDNFCAYCIVPYTRGRQKSRAAADILDECRTRLDQGAREITLLGQNVNAFGQDKKGDAATFAELLAQVDAQPGIERLRYVTPHPKDIKPADIEAFASLKTLCPRLHLPVQAGSDAVLARMGRKYSRQYVLDLVAALYRACPDLALSTDIIVGFPGESEEDFSATLELVRDCGFMSAFSFCYSDRPGTRASLFQDKLAADIKQERLLRLQTLQNALSETWLKNRVGGHTSLLIEAQSPRQNPQNRDILWQGRDPCGALAHVALPPDVDHTGRMVPVRILKAGKHSLTAEQKGGTW